LIAKIRECGGDDEDRWQEAVEHPAAPPGGHEPDQGPEQEAEDRRHPDEYERPRQRLKHVVGDGVREERQRNAQVPSEDVAEVGEVRAEQALVVVDAERDLERVQRLRVDVAAIAGHHCDGRVARHEARDQEVQRDRRPERDHEEPQSAEDEPHNPRLISARFSLGAQPFGFRWRSMTPQSGTS
jgi:hypothetical protein